MLGALLGRPVSEISRRASLFLMSRRYRTVSEKASTNLPQFFPQAADYLKSQTAAGGLRHYFSEFKLLELAQLLDEIRPTTILELGGGATTSIFATYANWNPQCQVFTVDENEKYLSETMDRLVHSGLNTSRIKPLVCRRLVELDRSPAQCRYEPLYAQSLQNRGLDFLYIDGPTIDNPQDPRKPLICADAVWLLEQAFRPRCIVFDYRIDSVVHFYRSRFAWMYRASLFFKAAHKSKEIWFVDTVRHHSRFDLRSGDTFFDAQVKTSG